MKVPLCERALQLTTDGLRIYVNAIENAFGANVPARILRTLQRETSVASFYSLDKSAFHDGRLSLPFSKTPRSCLVEIDASKFLTVSIIDDGPPMMMLPAPIFAEGRFVSFFDGRVWHGLS